MLGLRWSDVDLEGASMTIRQTLQETPKALREQHGRWLIQAAKTERSHRRVPLSALTVEALRRQRAQQSEWRLAAGRRWKDLELVFTDPLGEPLCWRSRRLNTPDREI